MNERIKELAVKAKLYEASSLPSNWDEGDYIASPKELEKFAELIVRECATIANRAENDEFWIDPVGDLIKEHFGIKE
jgi:hypothetical protein